MGQDVLQCGLWFEAGSDTQWSQHSSNCLGGAVHIRDDLCGIWGGVVMLVVCRWGGQAEDRVRISLVDQGFPDMELFFSSVMGESR